MYLVRAEDMTRLRNRVLTHSLTHSKEVVLIQTEVRYMNMVRA